MADLVATGNITPKIFSIRGHRVMLDSDLAALYEVPTKYLNQVVSRHLDRFPDDFAFALSTEEAAALRLQIATSKPGRGGRRYSIRAFTEHGVAMLSSVLKSERAVRVNIEIIRAFIRLRQALALSRELADRMNAVEAQLENQTMTLEEHAAAINAVFSEIRRLSNPDQARRKRRIGFKPG